MVAQQGLGPSIGPAPSRSFDALPATPEREIDRKLSRLRDHAEAFARASISQKIGWLKETLRCTHAVSAEWVAAACRAKGISADAPVAGEEWVAGPALTLRNIRLLIRSLEEIQRNGVPQLDAKRIRELAHGALGIGVAPADAYDSALYGGLAGETWLEAGIHRGDVAENQASFYKKKDPPGRISLILGAGNVASIAPMDVLHKMFVDGEVCILKMNPVNEYLGPFLERAFKPFIDAGFVEFVYGGAEVGAYLSYHAEVDDIHITGSDKTHDRIVWGPPGPDRDARVKSGDPLLKKPISSELGNVSPVIIVPGPYTDEELSSMAESVAGMVTNNASFNCNAAKLLVMPKGFPQREAFLKKLSDVLSGVPPRRAYYPGAFQRYEGLTKDRSNVRKFGQESDLVLPWTLVLGLDAEDETERNFYTEPFCAVLSEVQVGSADPVEFLRAAVSFANDKVWGTLNAMLFVHPKTEADPALLPELDRALSTLRYGTVAVNVWPAVAYALVTTPWGGHPSATLANIQSGLGWVHNTVMLEHIEKCIVRGPLKPFPKPVWFPTHRTLSALGQKLTAFEAAPSWLKVPPLAMTALRG